MKILFLSYYLEPDLSAGSFRNSSLLKVLSATIPDNCTIDVVTTQPNRYKSFKVEAKEFEKRNQNVQIHRISMPSYENGMKGQVKLFRRFYFESLKITKNKKYDLVYASSSKLFTAFLGSRIAHKSQAKLYLDIRDIFKETIVDVFDKTVLKFVFNSVFGMIENYTFKRADHINLVSAGFKSYFIKYSQCTYSYFTNGIDAVFIDSDKITDSDKIDHKTIVYGGNIGEGQGMHLIIPDLATALPDYQFIIIGDGGGKEKLKEKLGGINNVSLKDPMDRETLISYYNKADYLFIHLNTLKAFERVLPSKLFEYGAFDKPIIAGVNGYAARFLKDEMSNIILFKTGDYQDLVSKIKAYKYHTSDRQDFVKTYSRESINNKMIKSILNLLPEKNK
jgi:glycosyltransferase involved in cell wall biosynthesis